MALNGGEYSTWVVDSDEEILAEARSKGLGDYYGTDPKQGMEWADIVVLCVMPNIALQIVKDFGKFLRPGAILTDFCGVKNILGREVENFLPKGVDYVGAHPMAGRERGSLANATPILYKSANALLIPLPTAQNSSIEEVKALLKALGCGRLTVCSIEKHDTGIAFTSQLMHVLAAALANHPSYLQTVGYEGGSLRDCTRVATLNPQMWTALCMENNKNLVPVIEAYIEELRKFSFMLQNENVKGLMELFQSGNAAKEKRTQAVLGGMSNSTADDE